MVRYRGCGREGGTRNREVVVAYSTREERESADCKRLIREWWWIWSTGCLGNTRASKTAMRRSRKRSGMVWKFSFSFCLSHFG